MPASQAPAAQPGGVLASREVQDGGAQLRIDITGLPNGDYKLRVLVDPPLGSNGRFRESDDSNNRAWTKIHIGTSNVTILNQSGNP